MIADKEKINQLAERIDEILAVLKEVAEDLKTVSSSIKSIAVGQITTKPPTTPTVAPRTPTPAPKTVATTTVPVARTTPPPTPGPSTVSSLNSVEDVRMMFPEDLDNMLSFEEKPDYVIIKPKQFLGSENFAKIASTVRGLGGEYISAGRDSHFRVYKKKSQTQTS
jgi:hypothetical protein